MVLPRFKGAACLFGSSVGVVGAADLAAIAAEGVLGEGDQIIILNGMAAIIPHHDDEDAARAGFEPAPFGVLIGFGFPAQHIDRHLGPAADLIVLVGEGFVVAFVITFGHNSFLGSGAFVDDFEAEGAVAGGLLKGIQAGFRHGPAAAQSGFPAKLLDEPEIGNAIRDKDKQLAGTAEDKVWGEEFFDSIEHKRKGAPEGAPD
jgi:hypothetical protein